MAYMHQVAVTMYSNMSSLQEITTLFWGSCVSSVFIGDLYNKSSFTVQKREQTMHTRNRYWDKPFESKHHNHLLYTLNTSTHSDWALRMLQWNWYNTAWLTGLIEQLSSLTTDECITSTVDESTVSETINSLTREPFELTNSVRFSDPVVYDITVASTSDIRGSSYVMSSSFPFIYDVSVTQTTGGKRTESAPTPVSSVSTYHVTSRIDNQSTSSERGILNVSTKDYSLNQFTTPAFTASPSDREVAAFSFSMKESTSSDTVEPVNEKPVNYTKGMRLTRGHQIKSVVAVCVLACTTQH